jgi:hypothetical protein
MKLLDQAMAAVTAGEVAAHGAVGEICCRLLSACEHATDVRRAEEWIALADRHVAWTDFVRPTCRTHYGGILVALGRWDEAERSFATRSRRSSAAIAATARSRSSVSPPCACARAATRRRSACLRVWSGTRRRAVQRP